MKLIETRLTEYCERRIPVDIRDQIKLVFKVFGNKVTLIETRPYFKNPSVWTEMPVAQFRFDKENQKWTLHYMDRNSQWHLYDLIRPSADFDDMLKALDDDETGIFWG
jgi:hypothetical protein